MFGVQLFNGLLHQQCFSHNFTEYDNNGQQLWLNNELHFVNGENLCYDVGTNKNNGCPTDFPWCLQIAPNPNNGLTGFDNFIYAMLNVFITVSLEGWVSIQYMLQATGSAFCWIYFVLLTLIVGFFVINLFLAVIESVYRAEMEQYKDNNAAEGEENNHRARAKLETNKIWTSIDGGSNSKEPALSIFIQAANANRNFHSKKDHHDQRRLTRTKSSIGLNRKLGVGSKSFVQSMYRLTVSDQCDVNVNDFVITDENYNINTITHTSKKVTISGKHLPTLPPKICNLPMFAARNSSNKIGSSLSRMRLYSFVIDDEKQEEPDQQAMINKNNNTSFLNVSMSDLRNPNEFYDENSEEIKNIQLRTRQQKKENEILVRTAIHSANEEPDWVYYINQHGTFVKLINAVVVSDYFSMFILCVIILNTISLSIVYPAMSKKWENIVEDINLFCNSIFAVECILKIIGVGYKSYFRSNWNRFDFFVIVIAAAELIFKSSNNLAVIASFRCFRAIRVFKILNKYDNLHRLFMVVIDSIGEVIILTLLLSIFLFTFSVLGMSLFGGRLIELGEERGGRWRFDSFFWSVINVFMVVSGDSWNEIMYDTVKATNSKISCLYFILLFVFGTFIVMNVFIALLLSRMSWTSESTKMDCLVKDSITMFAQRIEIEDQVQRLLIRVEMIQYRKLLKNKQKKWKKHYLKTNKHEIPKSKSLLIFSNTNKFRIFAHKIATAPLFEIIINILILLNCVFLALENKQTLQNETYKKLFNVVNIFLTIIFILEFLIKIIAFGLFQKEWSFWGQQKRKWTKITDDASLTGWTDTAFKSIRFMNYLNGEILNFPGLVIECIESNDGYAIIQFWGIQLLRIVYYNGSFASCYKLNNIDTGEFVVWHPELNNNTQLELADDLIKILKSIDLTDDNVLSYFSSNWNRLDSFVVFIAVLGTGLPNVSFLTALRAFRPLRIMIRFKTIKVIIGALLKSIPGLLNTFVFIIMFWYVFGITGVNWFSGLYSHCASTSHLTDNESEIAYIYNKNECDNIDGFIWRQSVYNFDNIFQSMHTLFLISTLSGWHNIMYQGIDSPNQINQKLRKDNKPIFAIYFIFVVIICSFFTLNLIISVVIDNFNKIKAEKDGSIFKTEEQITWTNNQRILNRITLDQTLISVPYKDQNKLKYYMFKIVENNYFEAFIVICIILNTVSMSCEHYNQSEMFTFVLNIIDAIFVIIFVIEAISKIIAYGFISYIYSNWNKFDFIISLLGLIGLISQSGLGISALRLFRIGRLLRLLHKAKTLKIMFWTIIYSLPSLFNIGSLIFVTFFIFSIIGMRMLTDYKTAVDDEVNFDTFGSSISLLFRVGTEDGWTDIYYAYLESYKERTEIIKVYVYFISFFVFGTLLLINLLIAVVLDAFQENRTLFNNQHRFKIIALWRDVWSCFDTNATKQITAEQFINVLKLTPATHDFYKKNSIVGPGFYDNEQGPFLHLMNKYGDYNNANDHQFILKKLYTIMSVDELQSQLKKLCNNNITHSDVLKLLISLRLRVYRKKNKNDTAVANNSCCVKLQQTIKKKLHLINRPIKNADSSSYINVSDDLDAFNEYKWYVSFDEALLALCSEAIGPRLPDNAQIFEINENNQQLKIEEWYAMKYNVINEYKSIKLNITKKKQIVPNTQKNIKLRFQKNVEMLSEAAFSYQNTVSMDDENDDDDDGECCDNSVSSDNEKPSIYNYSTNNEQKQTIEIIECE